MLSLCDRVVNVLELDACLGTDFPPIPTSLYLDYLLVRMHGNAFYNAFFDGTIPFTDPRIHASLKVHRALFDSSFLVPNPSTGLLPGATHLVDNSIAMFCGTDAASAGVEALGVAPDDLGSIPFPEYDGEGATVAVGQPNDEILVTLSILGVPKKSFYPAQAKALLTYIARRSTVANVTLPASPSGLFSTRLSVDPFLPSQRSREAAHLFSTRATRAIQASRSGFNYTQIVSAWSSLVLAPLHSHTNTTAFLASMESTLVAIEAIRVQYVEGKVSPVVASLPSGAYSGGTVVVELLCPTPGAEIVYSLHEETEMETEMETEEMEKTNNSSSPLPLLYYDNAIVLSRGKTYVIRALGRAAGLLDSDEVSLTYAVNYADSGRRSRGKNGKNGRNRIIMLGVVLPVLLLLCLAAGVAITMFRLRSLRARNSFRISPADSAMVIPAEAVVVGELVGKGSYGSVYRAKWRMQDVAVKRLHQQIGDRRKMKAFMDEARMLLHLRHANVVLFHGVIEDPLSLVTELMVRSSLSSAIHDPLLKIHPSMIFRWAHEVAHGLLFLEQSGVVHGDLKPHNVLLDQGWRAKLADFGMAVLVSETNAPMLGKTKKSGDNKASSSSSPSPSPSETTTSASSTRNTTSSSSSPASLTGSGMGRANSTSRYLAPTSSDMVSPHSSQSQTHPSSSGGPSLTMMSTMTSIAETLQSNSGRDSHEKEAGGRSSSSSNSSSSNEGEYTRQQVGTLFWAAPELLKGTSGVSSATDAYALGIILWELATRAHVYAGNDPMSVVIRVAQEGFRPRITAVSSQFSILAELMEVLWDENPEHRIGFADVIDRLAPTVAHPPVFPTRSASGSGLRFVIRAHLPGGVRTLLADPAKGRAELLEFHAFCTSVAELALTPVARVEADEVLFVIQHVVEMEQFMLALSELFVRVGSPPARHLTTTGGAGENEGGENEVGGEVKEEEWWVSHGISRAMFGITYADVSFGDERGVGVRETTYAELRRICMPKRFTVALHMSALQAMGSQLEHLVEGSDVFQVRELPEFDDAVYLIRVGRSGKILSPPPLPPVPARAEASLSSGLNDSSGLLPSQASEPNLPNLEILSRKVVSKMQAKGASGKTWSGSYTDAVTIPSQGVVLKVVRNQRMSGPSLVKFGARVGRVAAAAATHADLGGPVGVCLVPPLVSVVMEHVPEGSLGDFLRRRRAGQDEVSSARRGLGSGSEIKTVMVKVATALAHLHSVFGPHEALKPSNILVRSWTLDVLLVDFGMKFMQNQTDISLTKIPPKAVRYMAPEVLRGDPPSCASDIHSFASILYFALSNRPPFYSTFIIDACMQILNGTLPPMDDLSLPIQDLLKSCWSLDPARRVESADLPGLLSGVDDTMW